MLVDPEHCNWQTPPRGTRPHLLYIIRDSKEEQHGHYYGQEHSCPRRDVVQAAKEFLRGYPFVCNPYYRGRLYYHLSIMVWHLGSDAEGNEDFTVSVQGDYEAQTKAALLQPIFTQLDGLLEARLIM